MIYSYKRQSKGWPKKKCCPILLKSSVRPFSNLYAKENCRRKFNIHFVAMFHQICVWAREHVHLREGEVLIQL